MLKVEVDELKINDDVQGEGEPVALIPYPSADHACWGFELPADSEYFSASPSTSRLGESDTAGPYSTDGDADQVVAFLGANGIEEATSRACRSAPPSAST